MKKKITKVIALVALIILIIVTLCGCNKDMFDTVYSYDTAIVQLPDGTIVEGKVDNWTDYADGDQIQVKIDGTTYLVHSSNVALMT